ncbi:MAG: putative addiction module antidote protein [Burkholderiaceae bacterium]|jgi:probable addiction module antidote protein|nr:putative addiction module antidote protein [Burkholderiaceae bacterium]
MTIKTVPFDIVAELDSEQAINEYFRQVMQDGDSAEIIDALGVIARARGMTQLAKDCGLGRESLYKALSPGAQPRFDTILKVTRSLGLKLVPQPVAA